VNKTGIVFFAQSLSFQFSIEDYPQNFIGSELAGQPIRNSLTADLVADVINESVISNRPYVSD